MNAEQQSEQFPRETARRLLSRERPLIIGHRGCCALAPENTLPSFELALAAGADLVELDYQLSRDGIPMVIHDRRLDRTTNARAVWKSRRSAVADRTAAEIASLDAGSWFNAKFAGTRIPSLHHALTFIRSRGGVALIERKSGDPATCAELLRRCHCVDSVVVISFDWHFLRTLHELEPNLVLGALGPPECAADGKRCSGASRRLGVRWLDAAAKTGARLMVWNRRVSRDALARAHACGFKVWIYTVNDLKLARRLVALGVDGIITNHPSTLRAGDVV